VSTSFERAATRSLSSHGTIRILFSVTDLVQYFTKILKRGEQEQTWAGRLGGNSLKRLGGGLGLLNPSGSSVRGVPGLARATRFRAVEADPSD
jgi:hypothetical protein